MAIFDAEALLNGATIGGRSLSPDDHGESLAWVFIALITLNADLFDQALDDPKITVADVCVAAKTLVQDLAASESYVNGAQVDGAPALRPDFTYWDLVAMSSVGEETFRVRLLTAGLMLVDAAVAALVAGETPTALYYVTQAQACASEAMLVRLLAESDAAVKEKIRERLHAQNKLAAQARYEKDLSGKGAAKALVKECWVQWRQNPTRYKSAAAFAKDMLDKEPEKLTSQVVVERWVRQWRRSERG